MSLRSALLLAGWFGSLFQMFRKSVLCQDDPHRGFDPAPFFELTGSLTSY